MNIMTAPDKPRRGRPPGSPDGQPRSMKTRKFKQLDLSTAIKGARNAGWENFKVSIDKSGTISLVPMTPADSVCEKGEQSEWSNLVKAADKPADK
jgi:hypothetical protein